ncbi:uncharacterized protein [Nicotiana sylvestris]|uniref:uncharacterized protein n=1 Tax=Nicotiana sylvestris TaxID=4096 RepID=UPI00388CE380
MCGGQHGHFHGCAYISYLPPTPYYDDSMFSCEDNRSKEPRYEDLKEIEDMLKCLTKQYDEIQLRVQRQGATIQNLEAQANKLIEPAKVQQVDIVDSNQYEQERAVEIAILLEDLKKYEDELEEEARVEHQQSIELDFDDADVVEEILESTNDIEDTYLVDSIVISVENPAKPDGKFFEGCNLLLQIWMTEHLCHHSELLSYGSSKKTCIEEFYTRIKEVSLPEGVMAWTSFFRTLTTSQIQRTLGWLPVDEVIYMPADRTHFLLMGLKSIQPYAPYRVLRQLGRCQIVPHEEDLSAQAIEISPDGQFREAKVRQIWNECQCLKADTCVQDRAKGEIAPGYLVWYRRELEHKRPAKRPHILNFAESSQEQWDWLAKEKGYRVEIIKLKQQMEGLKFENNVQVATDLGEKNRLAQENEALRAQIQQIRIAADNQQRSRSDERLIKGIKMEISECRSELENLENTIAGLEAHWAKRTEERNRYLQQLKRDHEQTIANLKRKVATLEDKAAKQARTFEAENRHCYDLLAQMEVEIQQWQNQHLQDSRVLKARNDQIERLLIEKGQTRDKIMTIAHAIIRRVYQ